MVPRVLGRHPAYPTLHNGVDPFDAHLPGNNDGTKKGGFSRAGSHWITAVFETAAGDGFHRASSLT